MKRWTWIKVVAIASIAAMNVVLAVMALQRWSDPHGLGAALLVLAALGTGASALLAWIAVHWPGTAGTWLVLLGVMGAGLTAYNWSTGAAAYQPEAIAVLLVPAVSGALLLIAQHDQSAAGVA